MNLDHAVNTNYVSIRAPAGGATAGRLRFGARQRREGSRGEAREQTTEAEMEREAQHARHNTPNTATIERERERQGGGSSTHSERYSVNASQD